MKIKWIGVDCVAADHPMNTIQRIWHPKTFEEANDKLIRDFGKDWDTCIRWTRFLSGYALQPVPETRSSTLKTWPGDLATAKSGRYYIGCYVQKAMEAESMWGRFVAFKE